MPPTNYSPGPFGLTAEQARAMYAGNEAVRLTFKILGHNPETGHNNEFIYSAQGNIDRATQDAHKFLVSWSQHMGGIAVSPLVRRGADVGKVAQEVIKRGANKQYTADALYLMLLE
jgi:hypothetical protein